MENYNKIADKAGIYVDEKGVIRRVLLGDVIPKSCILVGSDSDDNRPKDTNPSHYHRGNIECIDLAELLNFNLGNVIKYVFRAGHKTIDPTTDLKKAAWYLDREISRIAKAEASK